MNPPPILEVHNLNKCYHRSEAQVRALEDVSLTVGAGDFVAVQGPSGSGKTTLLLAAGALLTPDAGKVLVDQQNPYSLPAGERSRLRAEKIGFVFQEFQLIPYLDVLENVLTASLASSSEDVRQRAQELIAHFGLSGRSRHLPSELSTGEKQRTALARALLNQPKLILADEPTGNLDSENAAIVLGCLSEFAQAGGGVLLVTHGSEAEDHVHRTAHLHDGKLR